MRIVYVLTSLGIGGAERQVLALGERMAQRGHTVVLLVLRPQLDEEWPTRLDVFHLNMRKTPLSVLQSMKRGRRFLREFRPDIVHSHGFHGNLIARLFRQYAASPQPISTIHNVYEGGWARMMTYRFTDRLSALTTAVSQAAAERFVRLNAVPARKCIVVSNGIDTSEFAADFERATRTRNEIGVKDEFLWLAAGRIVPAKDYPNLIRAFAQVRSQQSSERFGDGSLLSGRESVCAEPGKGALLWIAGEGPQDEIARLRSFASDLSLEDPVKFLGLRRDLPALLDAADGFVLGSAWEGMPLAVGEAMAMEKPVVATDVGGTRELIGEAGVLVPAKNANALAETMLRVMRMSPDDRAEMGRRARTRICQHFSLDAKADEWQALYSRVLRGRKENSFVQKS
jgi:glycosyltransferase involved in cell wall biosynthesis